MGHGARAMHGLSQKQCARKHFVHGHTDTDSGAAGYKTDPFLYQA